MKSREDMRKERRRPASAGRPRRWFTRTLKVGLRTAVGLCLALTLTHVVTGVSARRPANALSQRYSRQINAWVHPLFEQNWRLFAPDPESVNRQISARTTHTAPDGTVQVSDWFDLTAVDNSAVEHNVFPSHTTQNMLRRAWTSYLETHGGDDQPRSERARDDPAVPAQHRRGPRRRPPWRHLRVHPAAGDHPAHRRARRSPDRPARPAAAAPKPTDNRLLPWWKVDPDGN